MKAHPAHQMDRRTIERLLDGPVVEPHGGPTALVALLAALRADPRPAELGGEGAALRAFRTSAQRAGLPVRRRERRTVLAGLVSLKAALAAAALTATGGMALAAVSGVLPPLDADPAVTRRGPAPAPSSAGLPGGPAGSPSPGAGGTSAPSPSLADLCRAYRRTAGDKPGRALDDPAYRALVTTAGGREKVAGWCGQLLGPDAEPSSGAPGVPVTPDARPGGTPPRTGRPAVPSAVPTARPSVPAAVPTLAAKPAVAVTPHLPTSRGSN